MPVPVFIFYCVTSFFSTLLILNPNGLNAWNCTTGSGITIQTYTKVCA